MRIMNPSLLYDNKDPMYYLKDVKMIQDAELMNISLSSYDLIKMISLFIIVITILISSIVYGTTSSGQKRSSSKINILRKCAFAVVLSAIPFILTVLYDIFSSVI